MSGKRLSSCGVALLVCAHCGFARLVDLRPDDNGDRIAVVTDGKVAYLPAKRVPIIGGHVGGGYCRYIKRSGNGDVYVTGPNLSGKMFQSSDGGDTWTDWPLSMTGADGRGTGHIGAFTILRDDTFLIAGQLGSQIRIARSTDYGRTWQVGNMDGEIAPYLYIFMDNGDLLELADGTILMTCNLRYGAAEKYPETIMPEQRGAFPYVFRSHDGGRTWPDKSMVTMHGAETHLLELPSGKLMACIRKQRWHRAPGDPASVLELKQWSGYRPEVGGGLTDDSEQANRIKNMFTSESYDGGYTWVNERQATPFMKCSGDMSVLTDGTLVLQYLHRYDGPIAKEGIRARVSYDDGRTWEPEEYVIGEGGNYPGGIDMPEGSMVTVCPNASGIQAVHWRPLPKAKPELTYVRGTDAAAALVAAEDVSITVQRDGDTTTVAAVQRSMLPPPRPGVRHGPVRYGCNSALIQRGGNGALYYTGNVIGPAFLISNDGGRTWNRKDFRIQGWGSLSGFRILSGDRFLMMFEPVGAAHRNLFAAISTDLGATWSVQKAELDMHQFTHVSGKDNDIVELPDGALLMALQVWGGKDAEGAQAPASEETADAYVFRSADDGATWRRGGLISHAVGYTRLLRLDSGHLLACVYKRSTNRLCIVESEDSGTTWSSERGVHVADPGPGDLTALVDGTVMLQYLFKYDPVREHITHGVRAVISRDQGTTWEDDVHVVAHWGIGGYGGYLPDSLALEDGSVLTTCIRKVADGLRFQTLSWRPLPAPDP